MKRRITQQSYVHSFRFHRQPITANTQSHPLKIPAFNEYTSNARRISKKMFTFAAIEWKEQEHRTLRSSPPPASASDNTPKLHKPSPPIIPHKKHPFHLHTHDTQHSHCARWRRRQPSRHEHPQAILQGGRQNGHRAYHRHLRTQSTHR